MGDLLSASSLLLAIIGIMYGFWYAELSNAKNTKIPDHAANCIAPRRKISRIVWTKALPLACASCLLALVFLPEAVRIVWESYTLCKQQGISLASYDTVRSAFCVVVGFKLALAIHLSTTFFQLNSLRRKLKRKETGKVKE